MCPRTSVSLRVFLIVSIGLILVGCTQAEPDVVSFEEADMFERVGTIEIQEDDERLIGELTSMNVDADRLRLYIADRTMHRIVVLDYSGSIVQLIGQEGEGPGELWRPRNAVVWGDSIAVENARGELSIFALDGSFVRRGRLEEGTWSRGRWSLTEHNEDLYMAVTIQDTREHGVIASPDLPAAARLNHNFTIQEAFGQFHSLYQEKEIGSRLGTLDINHKGFAALGFNRAPDVLVFDLTREEVPLVKKVEIEHPEFMLPLEPLPMGMSIERTLELAPHMSSVMNTFITNDDVVVQTFGNGTEAYYRDDTRPQEEFHMFAALGKVGSDERVYLNLPGQILARDDNDRFYVELNHRPDERTIGVYEVNWP